MIAEWTVVRQPPRLNSAQVHVWFSKVDPETAPDFESHLSAEELDRTKRFLNPDARRAYIWSHGLLRYLIARYQSIRPTEVRFAISPSGKPVLPDTNFHFSLSHSGYAALFAFVLDTDAGIDIERIDSTSVDLAAAERVFTTEELHTLKEYDDCERNLAFFRGWTRKEAYAKCRGIDLDELTRVRTGLSEEVASVNGIFIRTFHCTEDLIGSLATLGEPASVAFFSWEP